MVFVRVRLFTLNKAEGQPCQKVEQIQGFQPLRDAVSFAKAFIGHVLVGRH